MLKQASTQQQESSKLFCTEVRVEESICGCAISMLRQAAAHALAPTSVAAGTVLLEDLFSSVARRL